MDGFDPAASFGPEVAQRYDDQLRGDEAETVAFLAGHAGGGSALEFAIGTGRIALPAHRVRHPRRRDRIVAGYGGAASRKTRRRQPGRGGGRHGWCARSPRLVPAGLPCLQHHLQHPHPGGSGALLRNAARHLAKDGVFIVEAGVPAAWIRGNQFVNVERLTINEVRLDVNRYDPVTQILDENHVSLTSAGIRLGPISCRLIWPSEMDLMARIAGLRLVDRTGGWDGAPFTAASTRHVSVYAR